MALDLRKRPGLTLAPPEPTLEPQPDYAPPPAVDLNAPYVPPAQFTPPDTGMDTGLDLGDAPLPSPDYEPPRLDLSRPRVPLDVTVDLPPEAAGDETRLLPDETPAEYMRRRGQRSLIPDVPAALGRLNEGLEPIGRGMAAVQEAIAESPVGRAYRAYSEPLAGAATRMGYQQALENLSGLPGTEDMQNQLLDIAAKPNQRIYDENPVPLLTGLAQETVNPLTYIGPAEVTQAGRAATRAAVRAAGRAVEEAAPGVANAARELALSERGEMRLPGTPEPRPGDFNYNPPEGGTDAVQEGRAAAPEAGPGAERPAPVDRGSVQPNPVEPRPAEGRGTTGGVDGGGRDLRAVSAGDTIPEPPLEPTGTSVPPPEGGLPHAFSEGIRTEPGQPEALQAELQARGPHTYEEARATAPAVQAAQERVAQDPGAVYDRLLQTPSEKFTDTDVFDAQALIRHLSDQGDERALQQAVEIAYKTDEAGLEHGRAVQAFSGWDLLSPEQQLTYAQKMYRRGAERAGEGRARGTMAGQVEEVLQRQGNEQLAQSKQTAKDLAKQAQTKDKEAQATADPLLKKQLRQEAADLRYLSDQESRVRQPRIVEDTRKAILDARKVVREGKLELPVPVVQEILARANAAKALPAGSPERYRAVQNVMSFVRTFETPSRWQQFATATGLPRVAITMWDLSAPFRQGRYLGARHPLIWAQEWAPMIKAFGKADFAAEIDSIIHTNPVLQRPGASKLYLAPRGPAASLSRNEEQWLGRAAGSQSAWKRLLGPGASEDAYITFLNKLRVDTLANDVSTLERSLGRELTEQEIGDMAQGINLLTGRGYLGPAERAAPILSHAFFAPRYLAASVERPFQMARALGSLIPGAQAVAPNLAMSRVAAQKIAATYGAYYAAGLGAMGLATFAGAKIGMNPLSSDFGDVSWGPLRFNLWGDDAALFRTVAREVTGRTVTSSGKPEEANRGKVLGAFLRAKLEPIFGAAVDVLLDRSFTGYPVSAGVAPNSVLGNIEEATGLPLTKTLGRTGGYLNEVASLGVPAGVQSFLDGYTLNSTYGGATGAVPAFGASFVGIGVGAYQTARDYQNEEAQRRFQKDYDKLNRGEQGIVDGSDFVKQGRAQQAGANVTDPLELARNAGKLYADGKATLEQRLAEQLANPSLQGRAKADAIKAFKDGLYQNAQTTLGNTIVAGTKSQEPPVKVEDQLGLRYWSAEAPLDPQTGKLDFKARDVARQRVLDDAARFGVDPKYITGSGEGTYRGKRFDNPVVAKAVADYEAAQEAVRPYYEVADKVYAERGLAQLEARINALPQGSEQRKFLEQDPLYRTAEKEILERRRRLRENNPALDKAGREYLGWSPLKVGAR